MKSKKLISLFCAIICMMTMAVPAFARASDQINDYLIDVVSANEQLYIDFSVSGTGLMDRVGCESIDIYLSDGSNWIKQESFDENDSGMSKRNVRRFANTVTADCEAGARYRVVVTIFAENSAGRDSRTQTFYLNGKA